MLEALELGAHGGALLAPADAPARMGGEAADPEVLQHAELGGEPQVLVHEAQPDFCRAVGRDGQGDVLAADLERAARVGVMKAREDLDQRRLARAV